MEAVPSGKEKAQPCKVAGLWSDRKHGCSLFLLNQDKGWSFLQSTMRGLPIKVFVTELRSIDKPEQSLLVKLIGWFNLVKHCFTWKRRFHLPAWSLRVLSATVPGDPSQKDFAPKLSSLPGNQGLMEADRNLAEAGNRQAELFRELLFDQDTTHVETMTVLQRTQRVTS